MLAFVGFFEGAAGGKLEFRGRELFDADSNWGFDVEALAALAVKIVERERDK